MISILTFGCLLPVSPRIPQALERVGHPSWPYRGRQELMRRRKNSLESTVVIECSPPPPLIFFH